MKRVLIALLLVLMFLVSGCSFMDQQICFEHNTIEMERTGQRTWEIQEGTFKIHMYMCNENKTGGEES